MRALGYVALSLLLFMGANSQVFGDPMSKAAESANGGEKPPAIEFKQDSTHQSSTIFIVVGILAALGCAGALALSLRGRLPLASPSDKEVRVIEKTVLSHGLLAIVIEVRNESFLVVQDKNKHTVTKLNVAHEE